MKNNLLSKNQSASLVTPAGPHVLLFGVGDIIRKTPEAWLQIIRSGGKLCAADISATPTGRNALPASTRFFDCSQKSQVDALFAAGHERPFDFAYLSTVPQLHLLEACRLDRLVRQFIIPKPIDSNFALLETLHHQRSRDGMNRSLADRILVHDHYTKKPVVTYLKGHMESLLSAHGFLETMVVYILEQKTVQVEHRRRQALECGMIMDLAPHALSVVLELVPDKFQWQDGDGNVFRRVQRDLKVAGAVRARDNACILQNPQAETFAALHFKIGETLEFIPKGETQPTSSWVHDFDLLIVVGKGVAAGDNQGKPEARDLKAIELQFGGQTVAGNFETNAVSGIANEALQQRLQAQVTPNHRGLNLPFLELAENNFSFTNLEKDRLIAPFQSFDEAFHISTLLEQCRQRAAITTGRLLRYTPNTPVAALLNRCTTIGLDHKWALSLAPTHLMFGRVPDNIIQ